MEKMNDEAEERGISRVVKQFSFRKARSGLERITEGVMVA